MDLGAPVMFKLWLDGYSQPSLTHFPKEPSLGELIEKDGKRYRVLRIEDTTNVDGHIHVYAQRD